MAPPSKKRTSTSYESDGGFVAQSDDDGHAPRKTKKLKAEKPAHKKTATQAKDNPSIDAGGAVAGGGMREANGEEFWELTTNRRVTISKFGGKIMVNVREYYEKDGQSLPGKKGISLPVSQFSCLVSLLPHIEAVLKQKGETLPRPEYDKVEDDKDEQDAVEDDEDDGEEENVGKKNFEATSEED
ncbi:hypothetical protein MMC13_006564 [Lambiella insularis]|nr:hypothetical protein [Lambiella insularis]